MCTLKSIKIAAVMAAIQATTTLAKRHEINDQFLKELTEPVKAPAPAPEPQPAPRKHSSTGSLGRGG